MRIRRLAIAVISVIAIVSPTVGGTIGATPAGAASPDEFVSSINGLRASKGIGSLSVDGRLSAQAQRWAESMAAAGGISHNPNLRGTPGNWTKVGENVGRGSSTGSIFNALVNSSGHYANMVNGSFNSIGVGVTTGGDGRIYTAHVFAAFPGGGGGGGKAAAKSSGGNGAKAAPSSNGARAGSGTSTKTSKQGSSAASGGDGNTDTDENKEAAAPVAPPAPVPSARIVAGLNEVGSIVTQG